MQFGPSWKGTLLSLPNFKLIWFVASSKPSERVHLPSLNACELFAIWQISWPPWPLLCLTLISFVYCWRHRTWKWVLYYHCFPASRRSTIWGSDKSLMELWGLSVFYSSRCGAGHRNGSKHTSFLLQYLFSTRFFLNTPRWGRGQPFSSGNPLSRTRIWFKWQNFLWDLFQARS